MVAKKNEIDWDSEILLELASLLQHQTEFDETVRLVTERARELFSTDYAAIMMVNPQTQETIKTLFRAGENIHSRQMHHIHTMLTGWVVQEHQNFVSEDIMEDPRLRNIDPDTLTSAICVPMRIADTMIGTLLLMTRSNNFPFPGQAIQWAEQFVTIVTPYLHNTRKIQEYFRKPVPEETLIARYEDYGLLGRSQRFINLLRAVDSAADTDVRVILEGKSGTGKEILARALHKASNRSDKPFIAVDCSAIPDHLIESELFGHVKGAFTGATNDRKGLFEAGDNGTLFLDEVANLSRDIQAKLLRVLQENAVRPVGSNSTRDINVRVIAASSAPLRQLVDNREFRPDLFYRLHVYPIRVPSLEKRRSDIPLLARHFLRKFNKKQNKQLEVIQDTLLDHLTHRSWEGNIRELENVMEQLVTRASPADTELVIDHLPEEYNGITHNEVRKDHHSLSERLAKYEAQVITEELKAHDWNQSRTARALDIAESSLRFKMNRLGIENLKTNNKVNSR